MHRPQKSEPMQNDAGLASAVNLARLARDLAQDIFEPDQVRAAHSLSNVQFEKILDDVNFQRMLRENVLEWNSAEGTAARVKIKAATAVEVALKTIYDDILDRSIPLAQRVEAVKLLVKLGELGERDVLGGGATVGAGLHISINLGVPGEGRPPKTIDLEANIPPGEVDYVEAQG